MAGNTEPEHFSNRRVQMLQEQEARVMAEATARASKARADAAGRALDAARANLVRMDPTGKLAQLSVVTDHNDFLKDYMPRDTEHTRHGFPMKKSALGLARKATRPTLAAPPAPTRPVRWTRDGAAAGAKFDKEAPDPSACTSRPPPTDTIICPTDKGAGDILYALTPGMHEVEVVVPDGVGPGEEIKFDVRPDDDNDDDDDEDAEDDDDEHFCGIQGGRMKSRRRSRRKKSIVKKKKKRTKKKIILNRKPKKRRSTKKA